MRGLDNGWLQRGRTRSGTMDLYCTNPNCPMENQAQPTRYHVEGDTGATIVEREECDECLQPLDDRPPHPASAR